MAEGHRGGPKGPHYEYNWLEIRRDHAQGMTISAIAKKHGVRRQTVNDRAKAEQWAVKNGQMAARAVEHVIEQHAEKVGEVIASSLTELLAQTIPLSAKLAQLASKTLDDALRGIARPGDKSDPAEFLDKMASAVQRTQEIARKGAGLSPTQPSVGEAQQEERTIRFVLPPQAIERDSA